MLILIEPRLLFQTPPLLAAALARSAISQKMSDAMALVIFFLHLYQLRLSVTEKLKSKSAKEWTFPRSHKCWYR